MKNEVFDFGRFWNYFKFDLKQMWRNHSKPAIFIGGAEILFYFIWVFFALIITGHWHGPMLAARIVVFIVAFTVLELYQTRTYGYLTDKKKGSAWLMIPASTTEKFVSMLIITLIVIPVLFLVVFFAVDSILALVDPTVGNSILGMGVDGYQGFLDGITGLSQAAPINFSVGTFIGLWLVGLASNFLYFLLCGICFKRYKILLGLALTTALSFVVTPVVSLVLPLWAENMIEMADADSPELALKVMQTTFNITFWMCIVFAIAEAVGIFFRIKTLKH